MPKKEKKGSGGARSAQAPLHRLENVVFEVVPQSESGLSMFAEDSYLAPENIEDYRPPKARGHQTARALEALGFKIRHIGPYSISGEGPRDLWEKVFKTKVTKRRQPVSDVHPELGEVEFWSHMARTPFVVPPTLESMVDRAYPQLPPTFFAVPSPLPPPVDYFHLTVPDDVGTILKAGAVHKHGITGKGVLVAMPDTGFYKHTFYLWHGYNYNSTLSPDATDLEKDSYGHGTAEAANIFSCAPDVDFVGVKMGANATLAFKTAADLYPAIITNSWGWSIPNPPLPNFLKPLEAAVIDAVRNRGITVCFSAGNGHWSFPGQMPDVLSVGGVYAHETLASDDFDLEASNYASSFDSKIYPGRHVPDVCGLVGLKPRGIYIMLPVEPGDHIDTSLSGGSFPNADETKKNDGWAVISGTSAASPQVAGVCALLKEVEPGLSPALIKSLLKASARDVKKGQSNQGQPAGNGHDGATGAGLVNALSAYLMARSVEVRDLFALPSPR